MSDVEPTPPSGADRLDVVSLGGEHHVSSDGSPRDAADVDALDGRARDALVSALLVLLVAGAAAWSSLRQTVGSRPSADQCTALVRQYVEHESRARNPKIHAAAVDTQLGALADQPALARQRDSCEQALAPDQVTCALGAPNVDELERCLQ